MRSYARTASRHCKNRNRQCRPHSYHLGHGDSNCCATIRTPFRKSQLVCMEQGCYIISHWLLRLLCGSMGYQSPNETTNTGFFNN